MTQTIPFGAPTASSGGSGNGVKVNNVGSSLTFTAPASTAERTLTVHAFGWYSNMQLEVSVSDGSFTTATSAITGGSGSTYYRAFTITYRSAAEGQTATFKLKNVAGQQSWGQIALQGASLVVSQPANQARW